MERMQAEALATAQREAFSQMLDARDFATKADVLETRAALKEDIVAVRTELKEDIAAVRNDLKEEIAKSNARIDVLEQRMSADMNVVKKLLEQQDAKIEMCTTDTENKLVKWLIGSLVAQTTLLFALLSYLRG